MYLSNSTREKGEWENRGAHVLPDRYVPCSVTARSIDSQEK